MCSEHIPWGGVMTRSTCRPERRSKRSTRRSACAATAMAPATSLGAISSPLMWSLPWKTSERRSGRSRNSAAAARLGRPASSGIVAIATW